MKKTIQIDLEEIGHMEWIATCRDIRQEGFMLVVSEDSASWALSHLCELIVETLSEARDSGNDWQGA